MYGSSNSDQENGQTNPHLESVVAVSSPESSVWTYSPNQKPRNKRCELNTLMKTVLECSQACKIRKLEGSICLPHGHIAVNVSRGNWSHAEPKWWFGCMKRQPKQCGIKRGVGPDGKTRKMEKPSRKIIIDFILIDMDNPPIGYAIQRGGAQREDGMGGKSINKADIWKQTK